MAALYRTTFQVTGTLAFPIDMLRYDACYPAESVDANVIASAIRYDRDAPGTQTVTLEKVHMGKTTPNLTQDRWVSFSWAIQPHTIRTVKIG